MVMNGKENGWLEDIVTVENSFANDKANTWYNGKHCPAPTQFQHCICTKYFKRTPYPLQKIY